MANETKLLRRSCRSLNYEICRQKISSSILLPFQNLPLPERPRFLCERSHPLILAGFSGDFPLRLANATATRQQSQLSQTAKLCIRSFEHLYHFSKCLVYLIISLLKSCLPLFIATRVRYHIHKPSKYQPSNQNLKLAQ